MTTRSRARVQHHRRQARRRHYHLLQSVIIGSGGNDTLLSRGASEVIGGGGNDTLEETEGLDESGGALSGATIWTADPATTRSWSASVPAVIKAGGGRDVIRAKNGRADGIDCGGGKDTVTFDEGLDDVADNCEKQKT